MEMGESIGSMTTISILSFSGFIFFFLSDGSTCSMGDCNGDDSANFGNVSLIEGSSANGIVVGLKSTLIMSSLYTYGRGTICGAKNSIESSKGHGMSCNVSSAGSERSFLFSFTYLSRKVAQRLMHILSVTKAEFLKSSIRTHSKCYYQKAQQWQKDSKVNRIQYVSESKLNEITNPHTFGTEQGGA
uniref:Uncharacterized protein n=1 Tax=Glossina morsitans morsitans TaxID=37546 RepID=A0A1B0FG96_GLOMM